MCAIKVDKKTDKKSNKIDLFSDISKGDLNKRLKISEPDFVKPMLATLTNNYFSSNDWIYEHKFDGERCLTFKKNGKVKLISRNDKLMNDKYPELVKAFEAQEADNFIVDGEIVSLNAKGVSNFELLQSRINLSNTSKIKQEESKIKIIYRIFDCMYAEGYDIRQMPLSDRKQVLHKLLKYNSILTYTVHRSGNGLKFFKEACELKWEGLIAKRFDSEYVGVRSPNWLKFKCVMKQELVIGGYTEPKGSRQYFGALLVGYFEDGKFMYAGKVGTGYTQATLEMLGKKLEKIQVKTCPFSNYDESTLGVHWVKPSIVAEFKFANWTRDNRLRVGRYKGLRDDKAAKDVVKEVPTLIGPQSISVKASKSKK